MLRSFFLAIVESYFREIPQDSGSCQHCGRVRNNGPALVNNCEWDTTHGLIGTRQDWGAGPGGASDSVRVCYMEKVFRVNNASHMYKFKPHPRTRKTKARKKFERLRRSLGYRLVVDLPSLTLAIYADACKRGMQTMVDSASRLFNLAAKEKFTQVAINILDANIFEKKLESYIPIHHPRTHSLVHPPTRGNVCRRKMDCPVLKLPR